MKKTAFNKFITIFDKSDNVFISRNDEKKLLGDMEYTTRFYYICNGVIILKISEYYYQAYFSGKKPYYFLLENNQTVRSTKSQRKSKRREDYTFIEYMDLEKWISDAWNKSMNAWKTKYTYEISGPLAFSGFARIIASDNGITLINNDFVTAFENICDHTAIYTGNEKVETSPAIFRDSYNDITLFALPVRVTNISDAMKRELIEGWC